MLLEDKTAVIYGGGGAIGGAVARVFAREGARVFLAGRTQAKLDQVVRDITNDGGTAESSIVDALDQLSVAGHVEHVVRRAGRIDVALNAVGIPHVQGPPLAELTLADFALPITSYMRTNFLTAKAVASHMQAQGSGVILTLSTPGSQMAGVGFLGYGVTCGAVETFSRILSGEVGGDGVRVVCLRPHAIPESIATSHVREVFGPVAMRAGMSIQDWLAGLAQGDTLLGRLPTLVEVAEYAALVASDRASAMTGAIVNINCGSLVG